MDSAAIVATGFNSHAGIMVVVRELGCKGVTVFVEVSIPMRELWSL